METTSKEQTTHAAMSTAISTAQTTEGATTTSMAISTVGQGKLWFTQTQQSNFSNKLNYFEWFQLPSAVALIRGLDIRAHKIKQILKIWERKKNACGNNKNRNTNRTKNDLVISEHKLITPSTTGTYSVNYCMFCFFSFLRVIACNSGAQMRVRDSSATRIFF